MNIYKVFAVIAAVVVVDMFCDENVTPSVQCPGQNFDDLRNRIQVKPCRKTRCTLRKSTNITVIFKFKPKNEVKTLKNDVSASFGGIQLPFIGVTGTSACNDITLEDGTPTKCPLAPDQEYIYTNVFPVEQFYPSVDLIVNWALNDGTQDVICFKVPAVIK